MPNVSNVRVYGLDEAIRAAKYPKAVELDGLTAELTKGIKVCLNCPTGEGEYVTISTSTQVLSSTHTRSPILGIIICAAWVYVHLCPSQYTLPSIKYLSRNSIRSILPVIWLTEIANLTFRNIFLHNYIHLAFFIWRI